MRAFVGLLLVRAACAEAPLESWTILELPLVQKGNVSTQLHTSFRLRDQFRHVYYARFGPNLRVRLAKNVTAVGGFWYTDQKFARRSRWDDMHRFWAGVERPVRIGSSALQVRGVYERWFAGPRPNDNRTRWMLLYRRPIGQGVTLSTGSETFTDNRGYCAQRLIAGVGFPVSQRFVLETGYMWDGRLERIGGPRQMITTSFRSRQRER
jgi:hypothetical protein